MNSFNRWIRSKSGIYTIVGVVVVALVVAVVGQQLGWWGGPGTAGLPDVDVDCMPTCEENDGRFLLVAGSGQSTFAGEKTAVWISVPQQYDTFTLSVFDGDSGKDPDGNFDKYNGDWDTTYEEVQYVLYADALMDGSTSTIVGQWSSNDMLDNAWYDIPIGNVTEAVGDNSDYYYRFEASMSADTIGSNQFKLKTKNAYLSMGKSSIPGTSFGIVGFLFGLNDANIIYPELASGNFGVSTYSGTWEFQFYLPENTTSFEIWNGDADFGTSLPSGYYDTDDENTIGKPDWASAAAIPERAAGKGVPADDSSTLVFRRSPSITFVVFDPDGNEIARDPNIGGTEEWERFLVSVDPNDAPDVAVNNLPEGYYKLRIEGLDINNALWIRTDLELFHNPPPECEWENTDIDAEYAIIALNPDSCQGQQNGLLFHGTSYTQLLGKAISNGCLRSVGTHTVESLGVEYVGEYDESNTQVKIIPDPYQVSEPVSVDIAPPDCSHPDAHQMDGKDFTGEVSLEPGLYCISGDVTINAGDVVKGDDVTLYFIDGKVTINGGATVQLSAPYAPGVDVSPALHNILFYVPLKEGKKGEVDGEVVKINGGSDSYFTGVIYAPGSDVEFLGTSHTEGADVTQIIGWNVQVGGTADLFLSYVGAGDPVCVYK